MAWQPTADPSGGMAGNGNGGAVMTAQPETEIAPSSWLGIPQLILPARPETEMVALLCQLSRKWKDGAPSTWLSSPQLFLSGLTGNGNGGADADPRGQSKAVPSGNGNDGAVADPRVLSQRAFQRKWK